MLSWSEFEAAAGDIAKAASTLLQRNEVAFLATVDGHGKPR